MDRRDILVAGGALTVAGLTGTVQAQDSDGFFVPPEEAPHQRTFMQWPVNTSVYADRTFLEIVQETIADIANTISACEPVTMLAARRFHDDARAKLSRAVDLWDVPTDDLWCRDAGPIFVTNGKGGLAVSHIRFNGWGNKQEHRNDGKVALRVAQRLGLPVFKTGLSGEAGGIEQNGHGLLMAHESSWVNDNRNPGLLQDEVENRLLAAYGADRMIWALGVRGEDITDYHIDSLARFTGPERVLMNLPERPDMNDPFHLAALQTHETLLASGLDVTVIPEPNIRRIDDPDFVASYANYYVCNGAVIAAEFGDEDTDAIAAESLSKHYPGREIVMLSVDPLGELGGGIHCATQQMPAT